LADNQLSVLCGHVRKRERERKKGREREISSEQSHHHSDYTLSAFRIARPLIENYTSCVPACAELRAVLAPLPVCSLARVDSFYLCGLGCEDTKSESERAREQESEGAREQESERAREQESERARERESERARERESKRAREQASKRARERESEREKVRENPSSVVCGHDTIESGSAKGRESE